MGNNKKWYIKQTLTSFMNLSINFMAPCPKGMAKSTTKNEMSVCLIYHFLLFSIFSIRYLLFILL